ncbi:ribonuclease BN [Hahella sp. CCB-MM4]|uniref:YihY/virulence factor BrkB family protein n=1 Tax=Hahella sp. (strain CCB-MM4) TaxID=1926491 RepID=UPI000B9C538D|nr:YihY/virulence factor BrkB family protein [Hahella sp. CCB-MM4]OZG72026.1 ribonuclease BN [Hahella sp. CCB-MM4]
MTESVSDNWLVKFERWLWQHETANSSRWMNIGWHTARVFFAVIRDVIGGQITLHAMSLVYTTLLSIVPFLALSFSVLKGFNVHHSQLQPMLMELVAPLGDKGPEIVENVLSFVDNIKVGVLGSVGLGLLIYTVISLVQKVERSFNEIWRVTHIRSLAQRFSNYLSVILVGPLLVFSALGATATVVGSDVIVQLRSVEPFGWLFSFFSRMTPYLMIIGLFTFLYVFIPNTRVKLKYAFFGGLVAGIIWQSAGFAFTKIVAGSTNYAAIYSGFAVGIVLLIWIYLAWLILLIGASVSFYAQHSLQITRDSRQKPSAEVDERTGLSILYQVCRHFDQHGGGTSISAMESELSVGPEVIQRMIDKMIRLGLLAISGSDKDELLPARSLDKTLMKDVLGVLRSAESPLPPSLRREYEVTKLYDRLQKSLDQSLGELTVADWVRGGMTKDGNAVVAGNTTD